MCLSTLQLSFLTKLPTVSLVHPLGFPDVHPPTKDFVIELNSMCNSRQLWTWEAAKRMEVRSIGASQEKIKTSKAKYGEPRFWYWGPARKTLTWWNFPPPPKPMGFYSITTRIQNLRIKFWQSGSRPLPGCNYACNMIEDKHEERSTKYAFAATYLKKKINLCHLKKPVRKNWIFIIIIIIIHFSIHSQIMIH